KHEWVWRARPYGGAAHRSSRRVVQSRPFRPPSYLSGSPEAAQARRGMVAGVATEPAQIRRESGAVRQAPGAGGAGRRSSADPGAGYRADTRHPLYGGHTEGTAPHVSPRPLRVADWGG